MSLQLSYYVDIIALVIMYLSLITRCHSSNPFYITLGWKSALIYLFNMTTITAEMVTYVTRPPRILRWRRYMQIWSHPLRSREKVRS